MELRHLRHFVALAEEGHFGRAAERVFVVQQALSSSIKNLEEEVGVPLVIRTTRRVELTPAGREFLGAAQETLAQADRIIPRTLRAARGEVGHLSIGFVQGLVYGGLPEVVRIFRQRYPNVSLELFEMTAHEQELGLKSQRLDVGLMLLPVRDPALQYEALWRQELVAALPATHALAGREKLNIADLAGEDFVFFPRHQRATYYDSVMTWCAEASFTPRIVQEAIEVPTLLSLVAAGLGVFLPMRFFSRLTLPDVVYLPLEGAPLVDTVAVWRRVDSEDPVLRSFMAVAREVLAGERT